MVSASESDPFTLHEPPPMTGRWDLQVRDAGQVYPSWLEVRQSGYRTLVGRYEVQIEDDTGLEADSHRIGGVYGFLSPRVNACKKPNEWQTLDVTLFGRVVTIVLNGEPVIEGQAIPGITGGALDSDEGKPGPMLIQGDHGRVEFKKLILTPGE